MLIGKYSLTETTHIKSSAICMLRNQPRNIHNHVTQFHEIQSLDDLCAIFSNEMTLQAYKEENGFNENPGTFKIESCENIYFFVPRRMRILQQAVFD